MTPYYGFIVTAEEGVEDWSGSLEDVLLMDLGKTDENGVLVEKLVAHRIGETNSFHCALIDEHGNAVIQYFIKPEDRTMSAERIAD